MDRGKVKELGNCSLPSSDRLGQGKSQSCNRNTVIFIGMDISQLSVAGVWVLLY